MNSNGLKNEFFQNKKKLNPQTNKEWCTFNIKRMIHRKNLKHAKTIRTHTHAKTRPYTNILHAYK